MNKSTALRLGLFSIGLVGCTYAQDASGPVSDGKSTVVSGSKAGDKPAANSKIQIEFDELHRQISIFYSNESQARLKVYGVTRFDPEIAKPREYFIAELSGAAIIEPLQLNADDPDSISAVVSILTRFQDEAAKSGNLKERMKARKVALEAELSREETHLVELQGTSVPDASAIAASKSRVAKLNDDIAVVVEIGGMSKITEVMGRAKTHLDRPKYDFVASFEPEKKLYTLNAGYSFQVAAKDAVFYIDLLQRVQEFKKQLLINEAKSKKLREEVKVLFEEK